MQVLSSLSSSFGKALVTAALLAIGTGQATAQSLFSPAILVDEGAITYFELEQREQFLRLLNAPGNIPESARTGLIDERLQAQVLRSVGIEASPEEIEAGMEEFASRANMNAEEFVAALREGGVEEETFRAFVAAGIGWREYVRARFLSRARPTEAEVDRALATNQGSGGLRVLLSEIIIPITPQTAPQVEQLAEDISQIESFSEFSDAARRFSATRTAQNGGRMEWMALTELPAPLRPQILALSPGEITSPISLPNAVALFQMRDIAETTGAAPQISAIEYAAYYLPGGRSAATLAAAEELRTQVDTCDDLYGIAEGQPEEVLDRASLAPAEIPQDIAMELAKLDDGEVSTALTRSNGATLVFLMLCGRSNALNEDASRADVESALLQQRLSAFADSYMDQLRADALIIEND